MIEPRHTVVVRQDKISVKWKGEENTTYAEGCDDKGKHEVDEELPVGQGLALEGFPS